MSSLTTYVVGDGETAAGVLALVESWTRAGILRPSLWVTPSGITEGKAGPPGVQARYVHSSGITSVDLFEHIGRFRLELVRVVAVHLILHDGKAEDGLSDAAVTVSAAIESALPRRVDGSLVDGCRLHRALVMIPVSGATGASMNMTNPDWEVNVVISPEDRPDLDRASVFVRQPGNFEGHAATALSAVGGILRGIDVGVLDELGADSTTADGDVIVARVSIRSIVGDDILDGLATQILDTDALAPHGPSQILSWARPATQPELVANAAAVSILQSPEWAPTPTPSHSSTRPSHQGFRSALRTAIAFNIRTVGAVASWLLSRGRLQVERGATDAIVGSKAGTLVTLGPRPVADLTRATERLLSKERARISEEMRLQATRATVPVPSTWTSLRKLSFGLVDGGDLGDFPEPRQAGKRELLPAASVVIRPQAQWAGRDDQVIPADDPRAMRSYEEFVAGEFREAKAALDSAKSLLKAAETARAENPPDESDSGNDQYWPDDKTLKRLSSDAEEAQVPFDAAQLELESYKTWFDEQSGAVLWKVAADVARRSDDLEALLERISSTRDEGAPPAELLRKSQRSLVRWWTWTVSSWLVISSGLAYAYFGPLPRAWEVMRPTTDQLIYTLLAIFVMAFIILALANHGFYKAVRRYEWQLELGIDRIRQDKSTFVYAGQEKARLDLLYESLRDWVRVIGEVVHHPWTPVETQYEALPDEVVAALPAAAGLARQADTNESVDPSTLISAYDLVYPPGWSSRQFEKGYEAWEGEQSARTDEGYRAVDLDTLVSSASPRRRLRDYWASGAARRVVTERALRDLQLAVQDGTLALPTRVVSRIGRYGDNEQFPESEFFEAMATESTTFTVEVFTAQARLSRRHYVERSVAWMPHAARARSYTTEVDLRDCEGPTAVRVDISRRISARELVPFSEDRLLAQVQDASVAPDRFDVRDESADGVSWH